MNENFYLSHITTESNCNSILKVGFEPSVHGSKKSLWLGDGVYFWDANDTELVSLGYSLVKNKSKYRKKEKVVNMTKLISYNCNKYMNLENSNWEKEFFDFLISDLMKGKGEKLIKFFQYKKDLKEIKKSDMKEMWFLFGDCINSFIKALKLNNRDIDIVSYEFYSCTLKRYFLSTNIYMYNKQFCVKNMDIIKDMNNWNVQKID